MYFLIKIACLLQDKCRAIGGSSGEKAPQPQSPSPSSHEGFSNSGEKASRLQSTSPISRKQAEAGEKAHEPHSPSPTSHEGAAALEKRSAGHRAQAPLLMSKWQQEKQPAGSTGSPLRLYQGQAAQRSGYARGRHF